MSKIGRAIVSIERLDELARGDGFLCRIHPLVKLLLTLLYLILVVSFGTKELSGLLGMGIFLFVLYEIGNISVLDALFRMRIVLPFVCIVGIFNPFFDKETAFMIGSFAVTGGMISMVSLLFKGLFTVFSSYAFIVTTTMEDICYAMRLLHFPKILVTEFMLIYRYIQLLLREVDKVTESYSLRAPGQKGINIKAWGPLVGLMLLRTMDRADSIYKSMSLRGFRGEFFYSKKRSMVLSDVVFFIIMVALAVGLRMVPVFELVGGFITEG